METESYINWLDVLLTFLVFGMMTFFVYLLIKWISMKRQNKWTRS